MGWGVTESEELERGKEERDWPNIFCLLATVPLLTTQQYQPNINNRTIHSKTEEKLHLHVPKEFQLMLCECCMCCRL